MLRWIVCLLLFACSSRVVYGQGTGTIFGTVMDPTGAVVAGAKVTALLVDRGQTRQVEANERGEYVIPLLAIGIYKVTAESPGFTSFEQDNIELTANSNVRVDIQMTLAGTRESITVSEVVPLVDTRSSTVSTQIDSRRLTELPTNGRNVIQLATLLPGVTEVRAPQTYTGDRDGPLVAISGSRSTQNLFLFDGGMFNALFRNSGMHYPPPDALQEVKVLMNAFSAEYGRNSGAVFNVVTRSGSNEVRGSVWEFFRNHNLNARNFFAPVNPRLTQNQFGGTLGAPIKKNKLFVFGSFESLRIRRAALVTSSFPLTQAERQGRMTFTVRDPLTNTPFPGNVIPADRIDPVAAELLRRDLMPLPNRPDGQYVATFGAPQNNNNVLVRMDYLRGHHSIEGRYYLNRADSLSFAGQIPEYLPQDFTNHTNSANLGDTWVLTPTIINLLRISFTRNTNGNVARQTTTLADLGSNFPVFGPPQPPNLNITGRVNLGAGAGLDAVLVNESWHLNESVSWTKNNHSIKAGLELLNLRYLNRTFWNSSGNFTFNGQISGNPAGDFLLGRAAQLIVASPEMEQAGVQKNLFFYMQDDWRILPRLTVNLGLRYELSMPWVHPTDMLGTFRAGAKSTVISTAPTGMLFPGDAGVPRGLIQTDKNNWAPRIGMVWDVLGNGKTSVRSAYGVFFEAPNADIIQNVSQPWRYTFTINTPFSLRDPLRGQPEIPKTINRQNPMFIGIQDLAFADPNFRSGYVQNFNLNVQQQLARDLVLQLGYVGRFARKLIMGLEYNPAIFGPGATLANINARRIYQGFGSLRSISSLGNSGYNGMQLEVTKRYSKRFSLQGAYTWSRTIDMRSAVAAVAAITPNVFDLRTEYGLSDFHAAHVGSISWLWEVPRMEKSAFLRQLTGGWQLNGLATYRTGLPINVVAGRDNALTGTNNQRPNVLGNPVLSTNRPRSELINAWFDRAMFAHAPIGTFGNTGRNALIGPSRAAVNLGVFRTFPLPLSERTQLQFRSEFFNLLNQVNFNSPNANLNAGVNMGRITSADEARVVQLALRVTF